MTEEIWRPIEGYEGLYEVSNLGRVRSLDRYDSRNQFRKGRIMKQNNDGRDYMSIQLCLNGKLKKYFVHRLVAEAFLPNPDNLPQVNHKDEDKSNNRVDNLEWCTAKYNLSYGTRNIRIRETLIKNGYWTGLSEKEKEERRKEYMKKYDEENKERRMKYFQDYREKHKEKKKEYYEKNKEKKREYYHQYYLKRKAGL